MTARGVIRLSAFLILAQGPFLEAADWPQWRGGGQDGAVRETRLAGAPALDLAVAWRKPLGSGYSSVSVLDDLGVTMASDGVRDWVLAFDAASGVEKWRFDIGAAFFGRSGSDDGPMSTPAIDGEDVFLLTPAGRLLALDAASGELEWEHQLERDFGSEPDYYGYSTAPIVAADRLYLLAGGREGAMLVAFDRRTGEVAWKAGSDPVAHQNLLVVTLAGVEQVVAPADASVTGFATTDGRELWRLDFEEGSPSGGAVPIDGSRILVTQWDKSHLVEVTSGPGGGDTGLVARGVWTSASLGSSYAVPIARDGYLYGFSRRFLSCVDVESGELVWRSRPPGGQGLIGVDEHLLVVSDDGSLVSVEATPEGYRETGRLPLFDRRRVMTPPSFAGDRIYVRDLEELVAVDVAPAAGPALASAPAPESGDGPLSALLARIEGGSADERTAALERLEADYPESPVVEAGRAHFLYRGDEPDLVVIGDMNGGHVPVPMRRLAATDWFHASFPSPAVGRWEYRFGVFEETRVDPRNPRTVETPEGARSVAVFGEEAPSGPPTCPDCPRGTVTSHGIQSTVPERSYKVSVYTPTGYAADGEARYPTVIWAQGEAAQQFGEVVAWLDGLIGRAEMEPVLGVFFELPDAAWWEQSRPRFEEILAQDVMPFLESNYRLAPSSERALVLGGWSVTNMLLWGIEHEVGAIAAQSPFLAEYFLDRDLQSALAGEDLDMRVHVDWGSHDQWNPDWGLDVAGQSVGLADALREAGADVVAVETPGGANWTRWSAETGRILRRFFPPPV